MSVSAPRETDPSQSSFEVEAPDISDIVIDDGAPVDNAYSEKQMRLLVESLRASWEGPPVREGDDTDASGHRRYLAAANVGCFASPREPPLVPDVLLSLDVAWIASTPRDKRHQTYFIWEFGKPPDLVVEVVSNRVGGELDRKKRGYARMRVLYYVVWDPDGFLSDKTLSAFELRGDLYIPLDVPWFDAVGLGLTIWEGTYEDLDEHWLRWQRRDGSLIQTGKERADAETARADAETARADAETARADAETARAEREAARAEHLAAQLRELGAGNGGERD